jgi:phospholipid/cholesterol/gamma-HCH transport system substrate-binding protein
VVARVAAGLALIGAIVLVALIAFGGNGNGSYKVTAQMLNAGQLVRGDQVRLGGNQIGVVSDIGLTKTGLAAVEMDLEDTGERLRRGSTVTVRLTSLVGSTNRYIGITPGPLSAPRLSDGDVISPVDTVPPVDFDAILNAFDGSTREGLRKFFKGSAQYYAGRAQEVQQSLQYAAPAFKGTVDVLKQFSKDRDALNRLIAQGAIASRAVESRHDELSQLIERANTTAGAIADESGALSRSLQLLPPTLRRARTTFTGLRGTLDDLDPLVATALPATENLAPFLTDLRPLLTQAVPVFDDLSRLVTQGGADNDLTDLVRILPSVRDVIERASPRAIRAMDRSQREIDALLAYAPDIMAASALLNRAASYYDANGHYIRAQPSIGAFGYDPATNEIVPHDNSQRLEGLEFKQGARCPGGATQPASDGSSPRPFEGCKTTATPPGP